MRILLYTSYNRSAVGFNYGCFDYKEDGDFSISDALGSPVSKIIDIGYIEKAVGNISEYCRLEDSGYFILLYKRLDYSYSDNRLEEKRLKYQYADEKNKDLGKNFKINIAFSFKKNEKDVFKNLYYFFKETDKNEIARLLADSLIPDRKDVNFGYSIDRENFRNFFNEASNYKCDSDPDNITESLFVDVNTLGKGGDLREKFNLKSDCQFTFDEKSKRYQAEEKPIELRTSSNENIGTSHPVPNFVPEKVKEVKKKEITQNYKRSALNLVKKIIKKITD